MRIKRVEIDRMEIGIDHLKATSMNPMTPQSRAALVRSAFLLEWLTLGWMLIEAGVALGSGIAVGSVSLVAFGADSAIELVSACVLIWRLRVELMDHDSFPEKIEQQAAKIGAVLLFALAAYVLASAVVSLVQRHGQVFSMTGAVLTAVAIPLMYGLGRAKLSIAEKIGSRALRADAVESFTCLYLSAVVLLALVAQRIWNAWWIDGAAALVLVPLLIKEGVEAWSDE